MFKTESKLNVMFFNTLLTVCFVNTTAVVYARLGGLL